MLKKPTRIELTIRKSVFRRVSCQNCQGINGFQASFNRYVGNVALPDYEINLPQFQRLENTLSPQFSFSGYTARTPAFCNACIQSVLGCLPTPTFPLSGCIPLILSGSLRL